MISLTLEEYEARSRSLVFDVMACGEPVAVDCGEAGVFVMVAASRLLSEDVVVSAAGV